MCGLSLLNLGLFLCEGSILPKKELKAAPTTFEKLNIFTENKNMTCKYYPNEQLKKLNKYNQYKNIYYIQIFLMYLTIQIILQIYCVTLISKSKRSLSQKAGLLQKRPKKPYWNTKLMYRTRTNKIRKRCCSTIYFKETEL